MEESTLSIIALFISAIAISWTLYYNLAQKRTSSVRYVLELYSNFYTQEMITARRITWHDLGELMGKNDSITWKNLWEDNNDSNQRLYNHLQLILQFWFQLYALDKKGLLDRELALELFGYQFGMWRDHLSKIALNTQKYDDLQPDVFKSILENQLDWLSSGANQSLHGKRSTPPK